MALDFPSSPTTGQSFTGSNGSIWTWDGVKWTGGASASGLITAQQIDYDTLRLTAVGTKLKALGPVISRNWPTVSPTNTALDAAVNIFTGATANQVWNLPPVVPGMHLTICPEAIGYTCTITPSGTDIIIRPGGGVGYSNAAPLVIPSTPSIVNQQITLEGLDGSYWLVSSVSFDIAEAMGWVSHPYFKGSFSGGVSGFSPSTWTKNAMTMEVDSHGWWDAGNFRYVPKRPGRYLATYQAQLGDITSVSCTIVYAAIYINGSALDSKTIQYNGASFLPVQNFIACTTIAHVNGVTDYLEPYMFVAAAAPVVWGPGVSSFIVTYLGP